MEIGKSEIQKQKLLWWKKIEGSCRWHIKGRWRWALPLFRAKRLCSFVWWSRFGSATLRNTTCIILFVFSSERMCDRPLGMQNGRIKNAAIKASSQYNSKHASYLARLGRVRRGRLMGAWSAKTNNHNQWIQVDLSRSMKVTGIATQGREEANQWVTAYYVLYSSDGVKFAKVKDWWDVVKVSIWSRVSCYVLYKNWFWFLGVLKTQEPGGIKARTNIKLDSRVTPFPCFEPGHGKLVEFEEPLNANAPSLLSLCSRALRISVCGPFTR